MMGYRKKQVNLRNLLFLCNKSSLRSIHYFIIQSPQHCYIMETLNNMKSYSYSL